jgi:multisubunit Na+/H+ antiporter MnhC subunit
METSAVYYTCLNNDCPKHRNVFMEGDPEHAQCKRERLYLAGERRPVPPAVVVTAVSIAVAALGFAISMVLRSRKPRKPQHPMIREETAAERARDADATRAL